MAQHSEMMSPLMAMEGWHAEAKGARTDPVYLMHADLASPFASLCLSVCVGSCPSLHETGPATGDLCVRNERSVEYPNPPIAASLRPRASDRADLQELSDVSDKLAASRASYLSTNGICRWGSEHAISCSTCHMGISMGTILLNCKTWRR